IHSGNTIRLTSRVLGCSIKVQAENRAPSLETAESLLAAIESFLSTGFLAHVATHEPQAVIEIDTSGTKQPFAFERCDSKDHPLIKVHTANFNPHKLTLSEQGELQERMFELTALISATIATFR